MKRRGVMAVGVLVALVLVLGAGDHFFRAHQRRAKACSDVRTYLKANPQPQKVGTGRPGVVALGDSYLSGDVLTDRRQRWVARFAADRHQQVTVSAIGYTGYVKTAPCGGRAFGSRLGQLLKTHPQTLIVAGGLNDTDVPKATERAAATRLLKRVRRVPNVVVIGPVDARERDGERAVDQVLRAVAKRAHRHYVSMLNLHPALEPDGVHMLPAGHRAYCRRVEQALTRFGLAA